MLSKDELIDGRIFILILKDAAGVSSRWMQTLSGEVASHWYTIYRDSDWPALCREAAAVFRHPVTEDEVERTRSSNRCVMIRPDSVRLEQLDRSSLLRP